VPLGVEVKPVKEPREKAKAAEPAKKEKAAKANNIKATEEIVVTKNKRG